MSQTTQHSKIEGGKIYGEWLASGYVLDGRKWLWWSPEQAKAQGWGRLAGGYSRSELDMLARALRGFQGREVVLVLVPQGNRTFEAQIWGKVESLKQTSSAQDEWSRGFIRRMRDAEPRKWSAVC
jgi:hypothetical protein